MTRGAAYAISGSVSVWLAGLGLVDSSADRLPGPSLGEGESCGRVNPHLGKRSSSGSQQSGCPRSLLQRLPMYAAAYGGKRQPLGVIAAPDQRRLIGEEREAAFGFEEPPGGLDHLSVAALGKGCLYLARPRRALSMVSRQRNDCR